MKEIDPDWSSDAIARWIRDEEQRRRDRKMADLRRGWEKLRAAYAPRQERQVRRAKRLRA